MAQERPEASAERVYAQPLWLGSEQISGKTVFIYWEQGLGDTVLFCRYAKLARECGARVILQVQRPLVRLLAQLGPGIEVIGPEQRPADFDYHCPLLSLPLALGADVSTIPSLEQPLQADAKLCDEWAARLPATGRPRVGIAWSGGTSFANDYSRSIDLATFRVLLHPSADWICIQKGTATRGSRRLDGRQGSASLASSRATSLIRQRCCIRWTRWLQSIPVSRMSPLRWANRCGCCCHIMLTGVGCWIALIHPVSKRRLIRQSQPGSWDEALRQVKRELQLL